jgi:hypothetical protein
MGNSFGPKGLSIVPGHFPLSMLSSNFPGSVRDDEISLAGLTAKQSTFIAVVHALHLLSANGTGRNEDVRIEILRMTVVWQA